MKAVIENLEKAAVEQQCRVLRLPTVAEQCAPLAEEAVKQRQTYLRYLEAVLAVELEERERNTIARRIKDAHLPRTKTLDEFDFSIQQAVGKGTAYQISYMGSLCRDLPNAVNINLNPNANTVTTASGTPNGVVQSVITVSDSAGLGPLPNGTTFTIPT